MGSNPYSARPGSYGDKSERGDIDNPVGWMILQSFTVFYNVSFALYTRFFLTFRRT